MCFASKNGQKNPPDSQNSQNAINTNISTFVWTAQHFEVTVFRRFHLDNQNERLNLNGVDWHAVQNKRPMLFFIVWIKKNKKHLSFPSHLLTVFLHSRCSCAALASWVCSHFIGWFLLWMCSACTYHFSVCVAIFFYRFDDVIQSYFLKDLDYG